MSRVLVLFAGALFVHAVYAQTGAPRTKRGDTVVVTTLGNGKWGPPHDAIEVLRVAADTKETTFGAPTTLQATADGGVLVVDQKGLEGIIVRQFDAKGKFVRNLGGQGRGPGEYRYAPTLATHKNGQVFVRDGMSTVSIFGRDGKLINSFALNHNNGSTNEIVAAKDGSVYLRGPFTQAGFMSPVERPMLHYDVSGKLLDSVFAPIRWVPEAGPGYQYSALLADGRLVINRTDQVSIMIVGSSSDKSPLIAQGPGGLVPYLREEREELQASNDLMFEKCSRGRGSRAVVPETKMPVQYRATVDVDGRIWLLKSATALKVPPKIGASCSGPALGGSFKAELTYEAPPVFVAFQPDGTYLGEVRFPLRARVTFVGNMAWALVPDSDDVMALVKYRLY